MALNRLHTDEEREHLRKKRLEWIAAHGTKKTKVIDTPGNDPTPGGGADPAPGGSSAGGASSSGDNSDAGTGKPIRGSNVSPDATPGVGRKIPPKAKELVLATVDPDNFLKGLPAFLRLLFKAANNCLKIWNLLPFPLKFEFEDLTPEESSLLAECANPGIKQALPKAGKDHPLKMAAAALVVTVIAKLKATWKPRGKLSKEKVIDVEPDNSIPGQGGGD